MDSYQVALFITLALVLQCQQHSATDCKRRTTFIQIRIPQRTNVAVKYPKEINSIQYVPFPYLSTGSQCIKCQKGECNKCSNTKPPTYSMTHARKTNIVIDIKGTRRLNESTTDNAPKNSSGTVDGTIVGIYDRTSATSKSGATATANDKGNSSAATASGTSSSQIDTLAALNEEVINKDTGEKNNVEDIYAASEDGSIADAKGTAAGEPDKDEKSSKSDTGKSDAPSDKKISDGDKPTKNSSESGKTEESSDKKSSVGDKPGKDSSESGKPEESSDKKSSDGDKTEKDSSKTTSKPSDEKKTGEDSPVKAPDSSPDAAKSADASDSTPPKVKEASEKDKKPELAHDESHSDDSKSDVDSSLDKASSKATATASGS